MSNSLKKPTARRAAVAVGSTIAGALVVAGIAIPANAATPEETIWGTSTPSGVKVETSDTAAVELGTSFTAQTAGSVLGVRYYKTADNTGTHTGTLWSSSGTKLATATFTNEGTSGWQRVNFSNPVMVEKGKSYVVSYLAPKGKYAYTGNFKGASTTSSLSVPTSNAGKYVYGSKGGFPTSSYQSSNYWVDPVFKATDTTSTTPPTTPPTTPTTPPTTPTDPTTPTTPPTTPGTSTPGAGNTGVPAGTTLTASGGLTVTTANTVIDSKDITGQVIIKAPNVVIKNSKIHGSGSGTGIQVVSGNVTIYDSEVYNFENGIGFDNWAAYRVNVHGSTGDGVKLGSNTTLQDSWIHDLTPASGAHSDGMQVQSGVQNLVVRHNVIDLGSTPNANAALFMAPDLGPSTAGPALFENNSFNGGNYTVYCVDGNNGQYFIQNITFKDNTFGRKFQYGPTRVNVPVTWTNNTWADTGAQLSS